MHYCFPLGKVRTEEQQEFSFMGSGEQKIGEYLKAQEILSEARDYLGQKSEPQINDFIKIGLEAVRRSQSQDLYSHGLDMMICTPEGIKDHYNDLGDEFGIHLKNIQKQYEETKKPTN